MDPRIFEELKRLASLFSVNDRDIQAREIANLEQALHEIVESDDDAAVTLLSLRALDES